mmetsp:Transcript_6365/g.3599  ORF Transcript_6365/g.3599 Transcript_6365/m.3599 type:complete len:95 (+) Transcript_6365:49-333(+)
MLYESYYCPITQQLMEDPVIDPEGISYERAAIEDWLRKDPTSPVTRSPLQVSDLRPNRALRDIIDEAKRQLEIRGLVVVQGGGGLQEERKLPEG